EGESSGVAEAGEVGVAMSGSAGTVHHEQAFYREIAALHEPVDALGDLGVLQGREFVEQRRDKRGEEPDEQDVEEYPGAPGPPRPSRAGVSHDPEYGGSERGAEQQRQ